MAKGTLDKNRIYGGLNRTPEDKRDIQFGAVYTFPPIEEIPDKGPGLRPEKIKNQYDNDFCTGEGGTYASEPQEGVELSPEFQYAATKKVSKKPISEWGANIRDMLLSLVNVGSLETRYVPSHLRYDPEKQNRDQCADPANWAPDLFEKAAEHKKGSFLEVTNGPYDLFDNIRAALWKANQEYVRTKDKSKIQVVITGAVWKQSWTVSPKGIVPKKPLAGGFGHCFDIFDWDVIDDDPVLVAVLSNGEEIGDKGVFYFPREVVNREFTFGKAYILNDLSPDVARVIAKTPFDANKVTILIARFVAWVQSFFKK